MERTSNTSNSTSITRSGDTGRVALAKGCHYSTLGLVTGVNAIVTLQIIWHNALRAIWRAPGGKRSFRVRRYTGTVVGSHSTDGDDTANGLA